MSSLRMPSKSLIIGATLLGLLVSLMVIILNLPIRALAGDALKSVNYTDLEGANLLGGDLWVAVDELPGLTHLVYDWCPGLSPLRWCVDVAHPALVAEGKVGYTGSELIAISNLEIQSADLVALGVASGLIDARINGTIDNMKLKISGCPIRQIVALEGRLGASNISIFGISAGTHSIQLMSSGSNIEAQLSGATFSGNIQLADGKYMAEGEMLAPENMEAMAQSFMSPLGNNRFGWQINGDLPC